jgi:hypothetical protein
VRFAKARRRTGAERRRYAEPRLLTRLREDDASVRGRCCAASDRHSGFLCAETAWRQRHCQGTPFWINLVRRYVEKRYVWPLLAKAMGYVPAICGIPRLMSVIAMSIIAADRQQSATNARSRPPVKPHARHLGLGALKLLKVFSARPRRLWTSGELSTLPCLTLALDHAVWIK